MRRRLALAGTVAAIAATVLLLGGAFREPPPPRAVAVEPAAAAPAPASGFASGDTPALVRQLQQLVRANPRDTASLALLGLAYQQRARETGDPNHYGPSERVLRKALALDPRNELALRGLASLAASRHRFDESLRHARRVLALRPDDSAAHGLAGDALLELGRYAAAFRAFDRMVALKPNAVAYARISYARELLGDTGGAIAAMELAVDASRGAREPSAWALVHLGNLYLDTGRPRVATRYLQSALERYPGYAPALAARARMETMELRLRSAARLYRQALVRAPAPEYAVALADVLARIERPDGARRAYERAGRLERAFASSGGRNQLETALFDLDHDRDLRSALARAREGRRLRPSIEGEHVLAWALYKNGRCREARHHSRRALRLGTKDVGALYHRVVIERCLGNRGAAARFLERVHTIDPYFLLAPPSPRRIGG